MGIAMFNDTFQLPRCSKTLLSGVSAEKSSNSCLRPVCKQSGHIAWSKYDAMYLMVCWSKKFCCLPAKLREPLHT